jgi:hypothetical protein
LKFSHWQEITWLALLPAFFFKGKDSFGPASLFPVFLETIECDLISQSHD